MHVLFIGRDGTILGRHRKPADRRRAGRLGEGDALGLVPYEADPTGGSVV